VVEDERDDRRRRNEQRRRRDRGRTGHGNQFTSRAFATGRAQAREGLTLDVVVARAAVHAHVLVRTEIQ